MTSAENVCIRQFADIQQIKYCKAKISANETILITLAKILALAGNEVRLKILYLLREEKELCPCDLSDILNMTIPAVSQHLRKLKDADVVQTRKEGQTIFYSLKATHLQVIEPLFCHIDNFQNALI